MHAYLVGVLEGASDSAPVTSKPSRPDVTQVVRRAPETKSKSEGSSLLNPRTELAAFAVATAGLVYFVNHFQGRSLLSANGAQGQSSFMQGFVLSSAIFGVIGLASARYLSNQTSFDESFESHPAHIPSASPARSAFHPVGTLAPSEYRKFKLHHKEELSTGIFRFVFALPFEHSVLGLPTGQHVAISGTIDGHTVVRSYTPVSNNRDLGRLELLIRVYPEGKMGNYLKALEIGDHADIRGPKGAMRYRKGMSRAIGMVGGGTGITPLFQLVRAICEDPTDETHVSLVYCNRSEKDILLRERLDNFAKASNGRFEVSYVLAHPTSDWKGRKGYVTKEMLQESMPKVADDTKILLCGPPSMVNATKDHLISLGFGAPGAVSKMADQIFCF